jgi:hypothetical protein
MLAFNYLGMRAGQDIDVLVPYETLPAAMTSSRAPAIAASLFRSSALNQ